MHAELDKSLGKLSPIQREAVDWKEGAALVLAGPGAGKTTVLTTRIAKLLAESAGHKFRILALTFTTKAAAEMRERVEILAPGAEEERTFIGTFHSFCVQLLQVHGSHIDIQPNFAILSRKEDQKALLAEALEHAIADGKRFSKDDVRWIDTIKELKSQLKTPEKVGATLKDPHAQEVYQLYEAALRKENSLDFEGLILETCRLLAKLPALATRLQGSYRYWMIDEFQDTSKAQYWLLHYLSSAGKFRNVFAVADDDQIIYQWAGASYRQIEKYRNDYQPELIQLIENHRCPPEIVTIANRLVAHNTTRTPGKQPAVAVRSVPLNAMTLRIFQTDTEEGETIAAEISSEEASWGKTIILGRTRTLLEPILERLRNRNVPAILVQRRDSFVSPQFVWLHGSAEQAVHPDNKRLFALVIDSANRIAGTTFESKLLVAEAKAASQRPIDYFANAMINHSSPIANQLGTITSGLVKKGDWKQLIEEAISFLMSTAVVEEGVISDAEEDKRAWQASMREIRAELGSQTELSDIVQGIALRSKEPPRDLNTVVLSTVHSAKGLQFERVYVVGLAEDEMPSWQSIKEGPTSIQMEEERRNCFVAVTRTQEKLHLSAAKKYRNRERQPSRFLREMFLI